MRQIASFLTGVFLVTWAMCFALRPAAVEGGLWVLLGWLLPTVWAPTIFALALAALSDGVPGVKREIASLRYWRGLISWLLIAASVPVIVTAISVAMGRAAGNSAPFTPPSGILMMIGLQVLSGAVGEELGWRGFLLRRLESRMAAIGAAWLMATLWSFWHIAAFFFPITPQYQVIPPLPFLLLIVVFGVFLAFIFRCTGGSVLATIIAHLSLNISLGMGGVNLASMAFWWTLVGGFGITALYVTIRMSAGRTDGVKLYAADPVP